MQKGLAKNTLHIISEFMIIIKANRVYNNMYMIMRLFICMQA